MPPTAGRSATARRRCRRARGPNTDFHHLFSHFNNQVALFWRDKRISDVIRERAYDPSFGSIAIVRRAGLDLRNNLKFMSFGHLNVLRVEVMQLLDEAFRILDADDIKRQFGADNAWDVIEEVLVRYFNERLVTSPRQRHGRGRPRGAALAGAAAHAADAQRAQFETHAAADRRVRRGVADQRPVARAGPACRGLQPAPADRPQWSRSAHRSRCPGARRSRRGDGVPGVSAGRRMIIDGHCHAGRGDAHDGAVEHGGAAGRPTCAAHGRPGSTGRWCSRPSPANYAVANAEVARIVAATAGRLIGYGCVHPAGTRRRVRAMVGRAVLEWGFRGVKVHRLDAPVTREVCEAVSAFGVPLLYDVAGQPELLEQVAPEYPDVTFVVPHLGSFADDWRAHQRLIDQLRRLPNVLADTSGVRRFDYLVQAVRRVGPDRLVFGSDGPWLHPGLELEKIRLLRLTAAPEALVLGGNLSRSCGCRRLRRRGPSRRDDRGSTRRSPMRRGESTAGTLRRARGAGPHPLGQRRPGRAARRPSMRRAAGQAAAPRSAWTGSGCCPPGRRRFVYGEWCHRPGRPTVLVYGHYDVQPVDPLDGLDSEPFQPTRRGERSVRARGLRRQGPALRATGGRRGVAARRRPPPAEPALPARRRGGDRQPQPAPGSFVAAGAGLPPTSPSSPTPACWARAGRPSPIGLRGLLDLEVELRGPCRDLHAGTFGGAVHNPLQALSELLAGLHDRDGRVAVAGFYDRVRRWSGQQRRALATAAPDDAALARQAGVAHGWGEHGWSLHERTTLRPALTINGLGGGYQGPGSKSVIPAVGRAKLGIRLVPDQDPTEVERLVRCHLARTLPPTVRAAVRAGSRVPPVLFDPAHPAMAAASAACQRGFGARPAFLRSGGTIPAASHLRRTLGTPVVLLGLALPDDRAHAPNERVPPAQPLAGHRHPRLAAGRAGGVRRRCATGESKGLARACHACSD